ncbi:MAG: glycosyltransferase, partial [Candidatus Eremiobacterota bacterium]
MVTSVTSRIAARPPLRASGSPVSPDRVELSNGEEPLKIWLLHGSYTGGHASAARSLKEALAENHPGVQVEVINHAELSSNPMPVSLAAEKSLEGGWLGNRVRQFFIERSFEGDPVTYWLTNQGMKIESLFASRLKERIQDERPDLLVATMSPTASLLSHWKGEGEVPQPVHTVVTDFVAHSIWNQENVERYYVAAEGTREDLARLGADPSRVEVTGIPIRPDFSGPARDRAEVKELLGLDPTRPMVLLLGGSLGLGNFGQTVAALDRLPQDFQVVAICGRNEATRAELEAGTYRHPVVVRGFVDNMPDWLEASDLVVSKPGGLTTSEVLARGRPLLVLDPLPGMEQRNVDRLSGQGAIRVCDGS